MGNWSEEQKKKGLAQTERKEKDKMSRENLGKYFLDLSKLSFTALCLGAGVSLVMNYNTTEYWLIVLLGVVFTLTFARIGYKILKH